MLVSTVVHTDDLEVIGWAYDAVPYVVINKKKVEERELAYLRERIAREKGHDQ